MKKLILLLVIIAGIAIQPQAQTLVLTDTLVTSINDTVFLKWYHTKFVDSDINTSLVSYITLEKHLIHNDTSYVKKTINFSYNLLEGDSIKNPYGNNYYSYDFVKNYIYTQGEDMKRTLTLYQLMARPQRIFE